MLNFELAEINRQAKNDPAGFVAGCEHDYNRRLAGTAAYMAEVSAERPIVLLAGPSGSGKTTTAHLLADLLNHRGVGAHLVSLDNYYKTIVDGQHPVDSKGKKDFESPEILDLPLIAEHFMALAEGREVGVPRFDFPAQSRVAGPGVPLRRRAGEVVIFEGIHALNPLLSGPISAASMKIYVSARTSIGRDGQPFFKSTWLRLLRRLIRDHNFRGASASFTLSLWGSVRRGEKRFISPFKDSADIAIDTSHACEAGILLKTADMFENLPDGCERRAELESVPAMLREFEPIDETLLSPRSMLREFIGGSEIEY